MTSNASTTVTLTIPAEHAEAMMALLAAATGTAPATEAKADDWAEIATHVRDRRLARAEADPRKGLRKSDRRTIAAELGGTYTDRQWLKACRAYKAAGRHI
jgi:hypothetical protein